MTVLGQNRLYFIVIRVCASTLRPVSRLDRTKLLRNRYFVFAAIPRCQVTTPPITDGQGRVIRTSSAPSPALPQVRASTRARLYRVPRQRFVS